VLFEKLSTKKGKLFLGFYKVKKNKFFLLFYPVKLIFVRLGEIKFINQRLFEP